MNAIESYLAPARAYIQNERNNFLKQGKIPRVYRGYVSSFGVDVRQSGVLPTLLLYQATDANSQEDRGKVIEAIGGILGKTAQQLVDAAFESNNDYSRKNKLRRDVMHAAVALKLAMRTFPFESETTPA